MSKEKETLPLFPMLFYITATGFLGAAFSINQYAIWGSTTTESWQAGITTGIFIFILSLGVFYHRNYRVNLRDNKTRKFTKGLLMLEVIIIAVSIVCIIGFAYALSHLWINALYKSEAYIWGFRMVFLFVTIKHVMSWITSLCLRKRPVLASINQDA